MVKESLVPAPSTSGTELDLFRIYAVSNVALGRDEKVFLTRDLVSTFNPVDPYFTRIRDVQMADLVLDVDGPLPSSAGEHPSASSNFSLPVITMDGTLNDLDDNAQPSLLSSFLNNIQSILREPLSSSNQERSSKPPPISRHLIAASLPTGPGAALLPDFAEPIELTPSMTNSPLPWNNVHAVDELCDHVLDAKIARENQVLVVRRGGCSFSQKMKNIPSFAPSPRALQLVVVVSFPEHEVKDDEMRHQRRTGASFVSRPSEGEDLIQPLLDHIQETPGGIPRPHPIPVIMVSGGAETMHLFKSAKGAGMRRRWWFESQGVRIGNLIVI